MNISEEAEVEDTEVDLVVAEVIWADLVELVEAVVMEVDLVVAEVIWADLVEADT